MKRTEYAVRAKVLAHEVSESGWWIFKREKFVMQVQVNEAELVAFNLIVKNELEGLGGRGIPGIASSLSLWVNREDAQTFPIGSEVCIIFNYANVFTQRYEGVPPLEIVRLEPHIPSAKPQHEFMVTHKEH
ncbi:MAG: hypothetical protein Q8P97_01630 [bacterium]|nr:hypothetical protein [bacterium]